MKGLTKIQIEVDYEGILNGDELNMKATATRFIGLLYSFKDEKNLLMYFC